MNTIQIFSILGSALVLIPFAALGLRKMEATSFVYSFLNFIGSTILLVIAIHIMQYGFIILEAVWAAVSFYGMIQAIRSKQ